MSVQRNARRDEVELFCGTLVGPRQVYESWLINMRELFFFLIDFSFSLSSLQGITAFFHKAVIQPLLDNHFPAHIISPTELLPHKKGMWEKESIYRSQTHITVKYTMRCTVYHSYFHTSIYGHRESGVYPGTTWERRQEYTMNGTPVCIFYPWFFFF